MRLPDRAGGTNTDVQVYYLEKNSGRKDRIKPWLGKSRYHEQLEMLRTCKHKHASMQSVSDERESLARTESDQQASALQSLPVQLADMLQPLDARRELSARSLGVWVQHRTLETQQPLGLLSADTTQGVTDPDGKGVGCIDDDGGTALKHPRNGRVAEQRALVQSSHSQMAIGHGRGGCYHADLHPPSRGGQR